MVSEKRVPYMDIHAAFPTEMRLFGKDDLFFNVRVRKTNLVWITSVVKQCVVFLIALTTSGFLQYLPSYSLVHQEAVALARILQLPSFPTVSQDCLLHPSPLTVRYLLEANLPSECFVANDVLRFEINLPNTYNRLLSVCLIHLLIPFISDPPQMNFTFGSTRL